MANLANMMNNNNASQQNTSNNGNPDMAQMLNNLPPEYRQMADRFGGVEALAQNVQAGGNTARQALCFHMG